MSRITDITEETSILGSQYPGNTPYGPNNYSGSERERCYCCNRKFRGNFWSIINSPGLTYICKHPDLRERTEEIQLGIIPYGLLFLCPDCSTKEGIKNVLMRCHGCSCILIPEATYKVSSDLKIYCEFCYNTRPELFQNDNSFLVNVFDNVDREDLQELHQEWSTLEKIPLEKKNPYIRYLLNLN
jgi:hypothetical protein